MAFCFKRDASTICNYFKTPLLNAISISLTLKISHININYTVEGKITHVSGFQLNFVINTGYSDLTLADHGEVIWVGCDE